MNPLFPAESRRAFSGMRSYMMQVHFPPAPGDHGFTVVDHVKLFRNKSEYRFEGRIHQQIMEPIQRTGGMISRSSLYVVHSGYDYSTEGQQKKRERDMPLLLLDIEERPRHPFPWWNLGMTRFHLREFSEALPALERSLSLCTSRESLRRKIYAQMVGCYVDMGEMASARSRAEAGLKEFPGDPEILFRTANIYRALGDLERAAQTYRTLLTGSETGLIDSLDDHAPERFGRKARDPSLPEGWRRRVVGRAYVR